MLARKVKQDVVVTAAIFKDGVAAAILMGQDGGAPRCNGAAAVDGAR